MTTTIDPRMRNRLTDLLGISFPIISAGMGSAAGVELAAAVSNAGGLGVIGAASYSPQRLDEAITRIRSLTDAPFGIDTLLPASNPDSLTKDELIASVPDAYLDAAADIRDEHGLPEVEPGFVPWFSKEAAREQMEVIIDRKVPVYAAGLGNPGEYVPALHANGTVVLGLVGTVRAGRQVVDSGVDVVIAQGSDAGGHTGSVGSLSLTGAMVRAVGDRVPVVTAGGVSTGSALVATFALGAVGAWIGTRFLVSKEADIPQGRRETLVGRDPSETVLTKYRTGKQARYLRTELVDAFAKRGLDPLPMPAMRYAADLIFNPAENVDRWDLAGSFAGQGLYANTRIQSAEEIVEEIVAEATATLDRLASRSQGDRPADDRP